VIIAGLRGQQGLRAHAFSKSGRTMDHGAALTTGGLALDTGRNGEPGPGVLLGETGVGMSIASVLEETRLESLRARRIRADEPESGLRGCARLRYVEQCGTSLRRREPQRAASAESTNEQIVPRAGARRQ